MQFSMIGTGIEGSADLSGGKKGAIMEAEECGKLDPENSKYKEREERGK